MSMKSLLAILDHHGGNAALLETACLLTTNWAARLDVFLPYPQLWERDLVAISDEASRYRIQQIEEQMQRQENVTVEREHQEFVDFCHRFTLPVAEDGTDNPPFARWTATKNRDREKRVLDRARLADLVLMQRPHAKTGYDYEGMINLILRESGRLVMVAPPSGTKARFGHIAVAWNGSAESARAVGASLDLITAAKDVDVLTAESDRTEAIAAERLVAYLATHGVTARGHVFPKNRNRSVGDAILEKCHELGSDLLVMGAYTHARWREIMFGGVTRHILRNAELPIAMAH